jgi:HAD superfamily hydrolase (TIGR01459 family)
VHDARHKSLFTTYSAAFRAVFIDQYGVLHDGRRPYRGAIEALTGLKARGTRVVILSNSGRSGKVNAKRIAELGFSADLYDGLVTSADAALSALTSAEPPIAVNRSTLCLTLSSSGAHDLADALGLVSTRDAARADLLLISGSQTDRKPIEHYERLIAPLAARGVPCLCTNPDKLMLTQKGLCPGAGAIATLYEKLGGLVIWIGKPYAAIYQLAAAVAGVPAPRDILCVGDSIEHDIVGARHFGAVAALVRTGILAELSESALARECAAHGVLPDIVLQDLA